MNKFLVLFLIVGSLFFSGCGGLNFGGSSNPSNVPEVDITGKGLDVSFSIDTKHIINRRIDYEISFENSGLETVKIEKNNLLFLTSKQDKSGDFILDRETLDVFYNKLFENDNVLTLIHDQKIGPIKGYFLIDDNWFEDKTNQNFELIFSVEHKNYKTTFSNNLEIDLNDLSLRKLDSVSQAAPVQLTDIDFLVGNAGNLIIYEISDIGNMDSSTRNILLKDFEIQFGVKSLSLSSCNVFIHGDEGLEKRGPASNLDNLKLNLKINKLYLYCNVDLDENYDDVFTTATSGSFKYDYKITNKKSITLPNKRNLDY